MAYISSERPRSMGPRQTMWLCVDRWYEIARLGPTWLFRCRIPVGVAGAFAGGAAAVAAAAAAAWFSMSPLHLETRSKQDAESRMHGRNTMQLTPRSCLQRNGN